MTGQPSAELQLQPPDVQVQLVVHHEQASKVLDAAAADERDDRGGRLVHERRRHRHEDAGARDVGLREPRAKARARP